MPAFFRVLCQASTVKKIKTVLKHSVQQSSTIVDMIVSDIHNLKKKKKKVVHICEN